MAEPSTSTDTTSAEPKKESNEPVRPEMVWLQDKSVHIGIVKFSMSSTFKWQLFADLIILAYVVGQFTYLALQREGWQALSIIAATGTLLGLMVVLKFFGDLRNWLFTINSQNDQMGQWYLEDITHICGSLIQAGVDYADEAVAKAKGEKGESVAKEEKKDSESVVS